MNRPRFNCILIQYLVICTIIFDHVYCILVAISVEHKLRFLVDCYAFWRVGCKSYTITQHDSISLFLKLKFQYEKLKQVVLNFLDDHQTVMLSFIYISE